jgi:hypothetical protein
MGIDVHAEDAAILECGTLMGTPWDEIIIIRSSCSEAPPPVDISQGVSCANAIAGFLNSGYELRDSGIANENQVFILIANKKKHR